ncbi:MAG: gliding motility-associated C-terminal domain-containing protein [Bacteroidota bacterium]
MIVVFCVEGYSQGNTYRVRLQLTTVDTVERVACYHVEIANAGTAEWIIGTYNLGLFYDANVACYRSDRIIADDIVYAHSVRSQITSTTLTNLPYRDSLGFLRIGLSPEDQPADLDSLRILLDTLGTWVPTIEICFDLKIDDITSPETCLSAEFVTDEIGAPLMIPENIMQEWAGAFVLIDVVVDELIPLTPDRMRNACFVLEEDDMELCGDGIDNDDDGLIDCMDTDGCGPGVPNIAVRLPTCADSLGGFTIRSNVAGPLEYSIDGGLTFGPDSVYNELKAGTYQVVIQRDGIVDCAFATPVTLIRPDCSEIDADACSNGIDDDGDGLIDCADPGCQPFIDEAIAMLPTCDDPSRGSIAISSSYMDLEISLDRGQTFTEDLFFDSLRVGSYDSLILRNSLTSCMVTVAIDLEIMSPDDCPLPAEICNNGEDDDGDGLIDCDDPECLSESNCRLGDLFYVPNVISPSSVMNGRFEIQTPFGDRLFIDRLEIFDRWGNAVHTRMNTTTDDAEHGWEGLNRGQPVEVGVYVYVLTLSLDGGTRTFTGDLTVVR